MSDSQKQLRNATLAELAAEIEDRAVDYGQAAEILEVHQMYGRQLVKKEAGEGDLVELFGKPMVSRTFVEQLRDARAKAAADKEAEREAAERAKAEKAAAKANGKQEVETTSEETVVAEDDDAEDIDELFEAEPEAA